MKPLIFVDSDIFLDLFLGRQPFVNEAKRLFAKAETGKVTIHTTPLVLANIFYVLRKQYDCEALKIALKKIRQIISVIPIDEASVDNALISSFSDFEDALQCQAALAAGMRAIITRNIKDYRTATIPAMSAGDFLAQFTA